MQPCVGSCLEGLKMRRLTAILCVLCLANVLAIPVFAAEAPAPAGLLDSIVEALFGALDFLLEPFAGEAPESPTSATPDDEPLPNFGPGIAPVG